MKAVIFAGGYGNRIEEKPIIWCIISLFSHYSISEFIICLGYQGDIIKKYFLDYTFHASDFTI